MKKRIVLCADDYGQAPHISLGIINLLEQNRLSATSCMVNTDYWAEHASWLIPFKQKKDLGLHFNLTEGCALSKEYIHAHGEYFLPLSQVFHKAFLRKFKQTTIEAEYHAQIDAFQTALGYLPDFIDGHQHVHQFPLIRDALIQVYHQRLPHAYIRLVNETLKMSDVFKDIKKLVIYTTGTQALKRLLIQNRIPHNSAFAGIYAFRQADQYAQLFPSFLRAIQDRGLIMCHPGLNASNDLDSILKARFAEYQYFASDRFLMDCRAQGVVIERFIGRFKG
jgi:predicted glycoside hydrolase/deacetylase ChbG (UPF0249 family)